MSVDYELFLQWAESRFKDVIVAGNEIKLNSIFCEDYKHHLWCNPYGGKNNSPYGVFHCWKTDNKGSLVTLIMKVDNCSFEEALEILNSTNSNLEELEKKVQEIFDKKNETKDFLELEKTKIELPPNTYSFDDLPSINNQRKLAEEYLKNRKIPIEGLFICTRGQYANRIIIPYYNKKGELIYYNGRSLSNDGLRYLGPPKTLGIGKGDVLFVPKWPKEGEKIYLTEGEFDALSLTQAGLNSAAFGGKNLSEAQVEIIKSYIPVICLDADKAGADALINMGDFLLKKGFKDVFFIRAPKEYKDWNSMLQSDGEKIIRIYINNYEKRYDCLAGTELKGKRICK